MPTLFAGTEVLVALKVAQQVAVAAAAKAFDGIGGHAQVVL